MVFVKLHDFSIRFIFCIFLNEYSTFLPKRNTKNLCGKPINFCKWFNSLTFIKTNICACSLWGVCLDILCILRWFSSRLMWHGRICICFHIYRILDWCICTRWPYFVQPFYCGSFYLKIIKNEELRIWTTSLVRVFCLQWSYL